MRRRASAVCLGMALWAGLPVVAQDAAPADCAALTAGVPGAFGYELTVPPAGPEDGWCVLDGAVLRSLVPGVPNISATRVRLRGAGAPLNAVEVDVAGLRIAPRLGDTSIDNRLRAIFRLQTADLRLVLAHDAEAGVVTLREGELTLSGGTRLVVRAGIAAEGLTPAQLATGVLTWAELDWRNDGRLLRPAMELAGARISGAEAGAAVDAARVAVAGVIAALPAAALAEGTGPALREMVAALPQGRGRLVLTLTAPDGIGAARLALAALSSEPLGEAALARLFAGVTITADWQPGIAP